MEPEDSCRSRKRVRITRFIFTEDISEAEVEESTNLATLTPGLKAW